jgi:carboxyl-terminal processing protease
MNHGAQRFVPQQLRRRGQKGLTVLAVVAVFVSGFALGSLRAPTVSAAAPAVPVVSDDTMRLFAPFWQAWGLMHRSYVDPLDDNALMEGAIGGMMDAVGDRHTNYYDAATYRSINEEMAGQFSGIGATIRKDLKSGAFTIVTTLPDSPARESGLLPGDVIAAIDGVDVGLIGETKLISKIRGQSGTTVTLGVLRGDDPTVVKIPITRRLIVLQTVETHMYAGNIGYIALREFNDKATSEFRKGLRALNPDILKGLILDLRGNPGGYLTTAVDVTSQFLGRGNVLIEKDKGGTEQVFPVNGRPLAPDVPLIVLVDAGSASASELVSGALQDYGRATILGEQTYGKGSVQIVEPLNNGGAAHITIARWYTPLGRSIQGIGITPDVKVTWEAEKMPDRDLQLEQALLILRGEL